MQGSGELFLVFNLVLLLALSGLIFMMYRRSDAHEKTLDIWEDALNSLTYGVVFYDENDTFSNANMKAYSLVPALKARAQSVRRLSDFLNFLYDHALECDENLKNTLIKASSDKSGGIGFREVIRGQDGQVCLVEVFKTGRARTKILITDVSGLCKQQEQFTRLNESNYGLYQAVQAAPNGIFIVGPDYLIQFANQSLCKILNKRREDLAGQNFIDALVPQEQENVIIRVKGELYEGRPANENIHLKDGEQVFWYDFKITPVHNDTGQTVLFVGVLTDMTELKNREERLFNAQKLEALGRVSAGVAHDFNNLLSIIDGYTRLSRRAMRPDADISRIDVLSYLDRIHVASDRAAGLTRKMLTFGRHKIMSHTIIDLRVFLEAQKDFFRPLIDESIDFKVRVKGKKPLNVEVDSDALVQVLMNLVANARDAIEAPGGCVEIVLEPVSVQKLPKPCALKMPESAHGAKNFVQLKVLDNGHGMDADTANKAFDPFFTTKEQGKGTGLGLSLVYGLVQQMNGVIEVESTPGGGTVFTITFPIVRGQVMPEVEAPPSSEMQSAALKGCTVLVAEDEPDLLDLVSEMLDKAGMNVLQAGNGHEALVVQDEYDGPIDLLLADVVMPELGGVELAELMMALRPELQAVFMSGYPSKGQAKDLKLPEGCFFIAKPLEYGALLEVIESRIAYGRDEGNGLKQASGLWSIDRQSGFERGV